MANNIDNFKASLKDKPTKTIKRMMGSGYKGEYYKELMRELNRRKDADDSTIQFDTYKGYAVVIIDNPSFGRPLILGYAKAKAVLENINKIKDFVAERERRYEKVT